MMNRSSGRPFSAAARSLGGKSYALPPAGEGFFPTIDPEVREGKNLFIVRFKEPFTTWARAMAAVKRAEARGHKTEIYPQ